MKIFNPVKMSTSSDILALKFNRKSEEHLAGLQQECIKFTRNDDNGVVRVTAHSPDVDGFVIDPFDGDYDDARSRTKNYFITERLDGESIILMLTEGDTEALESNFVFVSYLGDNRFIVFAERQFEFINKTYSPPSYDPTSLDLPAKIINDAQQIINRVNRGQYNLLSVNECRGLTFDLDAIIGGRATNSLKESASKLKRKLESIIVDIGRKQGKNKLAMRFREARNAALIDEMKAFIIANHGNDVLSKIESDSLRKTNESFAFDAEIAESVSNFEEGTEKQISGLLSKMQSFSIASEVEAFLTEPRPPKVAISRCSNCGGRGQLNVMPQIARGKKKHEVICQKCDNRTEGGRIGAEAVYAWNLANGKNLTYLDFKEFGLSLLSPDEAQKRAEALRRYQSLKQQEISLRMKVASQKEMQELKKVKGKNTVLLLFINYLNEILKK